MLLNNKTVIITGGSEGVGAATARKFADVGANLMLVARNKKNLDGPSLYCAVIVKKVDEKTRSKTSINDLLRD